MNLTANSNPYQLLFIALPDVQSFVYFQSLPLEHKPYENFTFLSPEPRAVPEIKYTTYIHICLYVYVK